MALDHLTRASTHLAANLPDTCTIAAPDLPGAFNTTAGVYAAPTSGTVSYTGACMVTQTSPHLAPTHEQAGQERQLESHRVRIPASATTPDLGDVVTVTGSVLNPDMVGLVFEIVGLHPTSMMVSKILGCRSHERSPKVA